MSASPSLSPTTLPIAFRSEQISYGLLVLMVIFLPLSKAVVSVAEVMLLLIWLIGFSDSDIRKRRIKVWKSSYYLFFFPSFYLLMVLGMGYSTDWVEGMQMLNRYHYLLTLPPVVATLSLSGRRIRTLLIAFALAQIPVALGVLYIVATGQELHHGTLHIPSPFHQRPRASLFLCYSLFIMAEYMVTHHKSLNAESRTALGLVGLLNLAALILMQGRIGQLGLVLLTPLFLLMYVYRQGPRLKKIVFSVLLVFTLGCGLYALFDGVRRPFNEAAVEVQESHSGYPNSEPNYSSMGRRLAFYEVYCPLFVKNLGFGVGTGDLPMEGKPLFAKQPHGITYDRPHNQFLEVGILLGLFGLLFFVFAWWGSIRSFDLAFRQLGYLFVLLLFMSMWSDSTLATQGGVSFFMIFTALFMCRPEPEPDSGSERWLLSTGGRTSMAKKLLELPETARS
ncbi:MAG: O-antigen ligase family protein [Sphingomonadales bacterium]|nr:O-antigen ligase family protein [Sphingomonadales bacterium]